MASNTPLVSVIMPAHNAARFIKEAIQSVLNQTYTHWELLIIDDASTDSTPQVVAAFPDSRIRYTRVARIGSPSGVRNVGLREAQGDLIAFLDADDVYFPTALETLCTFLQNHPQHTAVYGFATNMDEYGNPVPERDLLICKSDGTYALPPYYRHTWENLLTGNFSCLLPGLMLRKDTLERLGLFNESLCGPEDYEFYVRLFLDNLSGVHCLSVYIYRYRIYATSLTKSPAHLDKIMESGLTLYDGLYQHPKLPIEAQALKSKSYVGFYRYVARERLIHNQPDQTRAIALAALHHPHVKLKDWLRYCLPLLLRSVLPVSINRALIAARAACRRTLNWLFCRMNNHKSQFGVSECT